MNLSAAKTEVDAFFQTYGANAIPALFRSGQGKVYLLIRDTPSVGMYVLNTFCMRGARLWGSRLHRACVV